MVVLGELIPSGNRDDEEVQEGRPPQHLSQMKLFTAIAAAAFVGTSALDISAANAKPFLYASTFADSRTYAECLKGTESILKKHQFEDFEFDNANKAYRSVSISGYYKNEYLTVEVECDQKLGVTSLSVAGLDNEFTYQIYVKLFEAIRANR